jgi:hypothetical protein
VKLELGPLLRYAGVDAATVWVQTDAPCEVELRPRDSASGRERTFTIEGHHYALVHVTGLPPDATTPYEVLLDGEVVWPEPGSAFPPSVLRTHTRDAPVSIVFGSCRVAAPHEPPHTLRKDEHPDGREVDALRGLALELRRKPPQECAATPTRRRGCASSRARPTRRPRACAGASAATSGRRGS